MDSEGVGATAARRAEDLRSSEQAEVRAFFEASRHVAPIGNTVAGLVALAAVWGPVAPGRLYVWFTAIVGVAVLQAIDAFDPDDYLRRSDTDRTLIDTNVLVGIVWGLLPWLDPGAFGADAVFRWTCVVFAFAVAAGSMGGLSTLTGLAVRIHVPLFVLVASALFVAGEPLMGIGTLAFLGLMTRDLIDTSRLLHQLVSVRIESADRAADAELEARHDPLTGLLNRAGAFERLEALRGGGPLAVMFIDLDLFKEVNDRLGHEAGDVVLRAAAATLRKAVRPDDVVARLGGDEFLVTFPAGGADLEAISARVLNGIEEPIEVGDEIARVSASIGVTVVPGADWEVADVLRQADHALYEAKRAGRRRVVDFDAELARELEKRTTLEHELRRAVDTSEIRSLGRPVVQPLTGQIAWVELLPRWEHAGADVPASEFATLADELGLREPLTRSLLDQGALARLRWRRHPLLGSASAAVRIAASDLVRGALVDDVASVVDRHGLAAGELQLVLTDTAHLRDREAAAETIAALRSMGVGIILGGFGGGTSTLSDLLTLPIDVVTVHRALVARAVGDDRALALLDGLQLVAGKLRLRLCADGVDTAAEVAVVGSVGMVYAQGDAVCPPVELDELENAAGPLTDLGADVAPPGASRRRPTAPAVRAPER